MKIQRNLTNPNQVNLYLLNLDSNGNVSEDVVDRDLMAEKSQKHGKKVFHSKIKHT